MRSLDETLDVDSLIELKAGNIAELCDGAIDTEILVEELEDYGPFAPLRKSFCEYLGVGESTLTGWLKGHRIPRMAKEAYVLLVAFLNLQAEVKRLRGEAQELKIIRDGDMFHVVQFRPTDAGSVMGTFVARNITDEKTARVFAGSMQAFRLAREAGAVIQDFVEAEMTENPLYSERLKDLKGRIKEKLLATFDPDGFRKFYNFPKGGSIFDIPVLPDIEDIDITIGEPESDELSTAAGNDKGEE